MQLKKEKKFLRIYHHRYKRWQTNKTISVPPYVLSPKDKENRELSDQRVLGSGGFVGAVLQESERLLKKKYKPKRPIEELIEVVAEQLDISPELICSGSRKRLISDARALLAYLAVEETGHKATDVARVLGIKRVSVHHAVKKGKKVLENLPSPL